MEIHTHTCAVSQKNLERTGQMVIPTSLPGFAILGGVNFIGHVRPFYDSHFDNEGCSTCLDG